MSMRWRKRKDDRGVAAVEMAMVLPLLVLLAFGVAEFGWAFAQKMDLNSAAREGARIAANIVGPTGDVQDLLCATLDVGGLGGTITMDASQSPDDPGPATTPPGTRGAVGRFWIRANYNSLTGFFDVFTSGVTMTSTVDFRVEVISDTTPVWWSSSSGFTCP